MKTGTTPYIFVVRPFILMVSFFFLAACSQGQNSEIKPNFLFVLVDDQPYDAIGFMGRYPFLKTPNIDQLAVDGVHFENFFVTQSICSPSRASFLTGTYPHIHGVNQNNRYVDPDWKSYPPYPLLLQEVGYQTAHIGKIHMAHRNGKAHIRPGFDYWYSFNGQGEYIDPKVNENGREYTEKGYITDILTEKTLTWLQQYRNPKKPFCLHLWHKAVHEKHLPAPRHKNLYQNKVLPTPPHDTHLETFSGKPAWQRKKMFGFKWRKQKKVPKELAIKKWPINYHKNMQLLRSLIAIDESLGAIINTLNVMGELENTVIIFSSDNGYFMGDHTFKDKRLAYENSMRVPMLVRYPKLFKPRSKIKKQCLNIDVAPTILELAGVKKPAYMQGSSLVPLAKNPKDYNWRKAILFEYFRDEAWPFAGPNLVAIRTENHKLVDNFIIEDIDELYDLQNDPGEMNNLIGKPTYKNLEKKLRDELAFLLKKYKYNPKRDWWLQEVKASKTNTTH